MREREFLKAVELLVAYVHDSTFQASDCWVHTVLFRRGLHQIKVFGEAGQVDVELANTQMEVSRKYLTKLNCQEGLILDMIFSFDNSQIHFFARKKIRQATSTDKERVTVMVCTSAAGSKCPLAVTGKANLTVCLR
jgi:hypothetical protein